MGVINSLVSCVTGRCKPHAHSIKVYALRKLGEMLKATERNNGAKGIGKSVVPKENRTPTLAALGIDKKISSLAQKIADLPDEKVAERASGRRPPVYWNGEACQVYHAL